MSSTILTALVLVLALLPIPAAWATVYLWQHVGGSWMLRLLAISASVQLAAATFVGWLATRRLLGLEPVEWGALLTAIAVLALELMPIVYALEFRRRRATRTRRVTDGQ